MPKGINGLGIGMIFAWGMFFAKMCIRDRGIEIDAGQGREAVFGIEHREFEDPEVVVGQGEGRVDVYKRQHEMNA